MENDIMVSVYCLAYNHEKYIRSALDGFVMQKTDFKYEVLVHDDASTDGTAQIIREYAKKYPEIIKPIYQTENQYSKGINVTKSFVIPRILGRYVAICEGDDYWTDDMKLQRQYDAMEKHSEVDICAHSSIKVRAKDEKVISYICPESRECVIDLGKVISGGGGFVATNSLFFRRELFEIEPDFRKQCPYDYALQIQGALRGGMLYLPYNMSAYRIGVPGSWTSRMSAKEYNDSQQRIIIKMLDMVNEETLGRYCKIIERAKLDVEFDSLELAGKYKELRKGNLRKLYKERNFKWKIKMYLKEYYIYLVKLFGK